MNLQQNNIATFDYVVSNPPFNMDSSDTRDTLAGNKIWYATFDGGCSADVLVLKVYEGIDAKFLYYALSEDKFFDYMTATAKGSKMPRGGK